MFLRKGVYPYEHMDKIEKFEETKLPDMKDFDSKLNDSHISVEDYEHAKKIWKEFDMKTLGEFHDIYLKSDVLLLADVFEAFRRVCLENYGLDPAWYFTSSGLAWDAFSKSTRVKLELLTEIDMLLMFEKGTRGVISMISKRFAEANNKYMGEKFNENLPSKFITYLDANNLYGWAMCQNLPVGNFEWMTDFEYFFYFNNTILKLYTKNYLQHISLTTLHYRRYIAYSTTSYITLHYYYYYTLLTKNTYNIIYTDTQSYNTLLTFKKKITFLIFLTMEEKKNYTARTHQAHPHTSPSPTHTRY